MMKLLIERPGEPPVEIDAVRITVDCGVDRFEILGDEGSLLVKIEQHAGGLAWDLAVFPRGTNGVRLKGGLR